MQVTTSGRGWSLGGYVREQGVQRPEDGMKRGVCAKGACILYLV